MNNQKTRHQVYDEIYDMVYKYYVKLGYTKDKASRKANITAVKNTNRIYNKETINFLKDIKEEEMLCR